MAKKVNKESEEPQVPPIDFRVAPHWRWVISVMLLIHLIAVFSPPFAFQTMSPDGRSPVAEILLDPRNPLRWYIDAAYLDHGYAFFAPNPGASHLVRYKLEFDDGQQPQQRTFPDLERHWPRLLYHRHFMLSEHLNNSYAPPQLPPELTQPPQPDPREPAEQYAATRQQWSDVLQRWQISRSEYEARWDAFENHLRSKYGASRVTMTRVRHHLAPPIRSARGINLRDSASYQYASRDEMFPEPRERPLP